jgi:hypothetical protein
MSAQTAAGDCSYTNRAIDELQGPQLPWQRSGEHQIKHRSIDLAAHEKFSTEIKNIPPDNR